jgi:hypothetical protein
MFKSLQADLPRDADFPPRTFALEVLGKVLEGTLYDHLPYDFHTEKNGAGEYIPLRQRRPSVRYALCSTVVNDAVSLLFSEGHFPAVVTDDAAVTQALTRIIREAGLNEVMLEAARRGSVGSVVVRLRVLDSRIFFDVLNTAWLTPRWRAPAPDTLESVTEKYKVRGRALAALGYAIADEELGADFWFQRVWDVQAETWYLPWRVGGELAPRIDESRSVQHGLGFVPMVWVRNLPGGDEIDGACTFLEAINTGIEIDYLLSQAARGLKYSSDPTLLIKEPALDAQGQLVKGAGNAITVGKDGDARLLEINGSSATAVIDFVRCLRELALESIHGNRSSADRIAAAQSGRAMELMNQALIWLADRLRISYGEGALLELLHMVVAASAKFNLVYRRSGAVGVLRQDVDVSLRWPQWYAPTNADLVNKATGLRTLLEAEIISRETAMGAVAADFAVEDVGAELRRIEG